jgi:hypothetical protein
MFQLYHIIYCFLLSLMDLNPFEYSLMYIYKVIYCKIRSNVSISCINIFTVCKKDFTDNQDFLTTPV